MQILNKKNPKLKLMNWKKIIKKPTDTPGQPALETLSAALLALYSNPTATLFSQGNHIIPSQWVRAVSQDHRAKSISEAAPIALSQGEQECGRGTGAAVPSPSQLGRVAPGLLPSIAGCTLCSLPHFSCLFAQFSTLFHARPSLNGISMFWKCFQHRLYRRKLSHS